MNGKQAAKIPNVNVLSFYYIMHRNIIADMFILLLYLFLNKQTCYDCYDLL